MSDQRMAYMYAIGSSPSRIDTLNTLSEYVLQPGVCSRCPVKLRNAGYTAMGRLLRMAFRKNLQKGGVMNYI